MDFCHHPEQMPYPHPKSSSTHGSESVFSNKDSEFPSLAEGQGRSAGQKSLMAIYKPVFEPLKEADLIKEEKVP